MLTQRDRAILDLEARFYARPGSKDAAITSELRMSLVRYYQLLNALIDTPAALAYDAVLVHRLQRIRAQRLARRRRAG